MTQLNLEWVKENFNKENLIVFDIGAADMEVSTSLRQLIPTSKLYVFEAYEYWHERNEKICAELDIKYNKVAVSDIDGKIIFHPCLTDHGKHHPFSGSIFRPLDYHTAFHEQVYGDPITVDSIRLETFCKEHNITPDFVHIDVEGAELKVFQNMGQYKPKCIWAETCAFACYDTKITSDDLDLFLTDIGYYKVYQSDADALYCQNDFKITPYIT